MTLPIASLAVLIFTCVLQTSYAQFMDIKYCDQDIPDNFNCCNQSELLVTGCMCSSSGFTCPESLNVEIKLYGNSLSNELAVTIPGDGAYLSSSFDEKLKTAVIIDYRHNGRTNDWVEDEKDEHLAGEMNVFIVSWSNGELKNTPLIGSMIAKLLLEIEAATTFSVMDIHLVTRFGSGTSIRYAEMALKHVKGTTDINLR